MVITIHCPECATSFPVDPAKVPEEGVNARCSSCGHVFRVEKPVESPEPEFETPTFAAEDLGAPEVETPTSAAEGFERDRDAETDFSIGVEEPAGTSSEGDWVVETEDDINADGLDIEPMETVETTVDDARTSFDTGGKEPAADDDAFFGGGFGATTEAEEAVDAPVEEAAAEADGEEEGESAAEPAVTGFTFGKRDPTDKAKRLARVLVSDMIMYNPERHENALANGTLKEDFEEEIEKSWKEYVEQVGDEMANAHPFWKEALNDVLAKGEDIF